VGEGAPLITPGRDRLPVKFPPPGKEEANRWKRAGKVKRERGGRKRTDEEECYRGGSFAAQKRQRK